MAVRARILDQQRNVVAELGSYPSNGPLGSLTVDRPRFVPEVDRQQIGRDDTGGLVIWNGAGDGGTALANGYYRLQVEEPDGSKLEAEFYLEHQAWQAGDVTVALPARGSEARIRWNFSEAVNLRFELFNLAGERVWQAVGGGISGELRWNLSTASGRPVAGGVYLLLCRVTSLDGALEEQRVIKLAVVR